MGLVEGLAAVREEAAPHLVAASQPGRAKPVRVAQGLPRGRHDVGLAPLEDGLGPPGAADPSGRDARRLQAGLADGASHGGIALAPDGETVTVHRPDVSFDTAIGSLPIARATPLRCE